jgi:hypothetical protein
MVVISFSWFNLQGSSSGQAFPLYYIIWSDAVLNRLLNLKVAKDRKGMAPNKPLLVLAILDLVESGLVGMDGLVHKDAQLNLRFRFGALTQELPQTTLLAAPQL